jgi:septal ring factor EnvC (AmiA/AmiB activator)
MVRDGIKSFYRAKIEEAEGEIHEKTQNLRRLEAQRNALNAKGNQTAHALHASTALELLLLYSQMCLVAFKRSN